VERVRGMPFLHFRFGQGVCVRRNPQYSRSLSFHGEVHSVPAGLRQQSRSFFCFVVYQYRITMFRIETALKFCLWRFTHVKVMGKVIAKGTFLSIFVI